MYQKVRIYISSFLISFFIISCQPKEKFNWNAGFSAPKFYEATGPFVEYFYQGKSIAGTSSGVGIDLGWGITSGSYVGGEQYKPVPDSIAVNWIYAVDRYQYEGGFKLPRNKMLKLFEKKVIDSYGDEKDYSLIVTGMAPGGNVSVWMQGGTANTEICKFKVKNKGIWQEKDKDYNKYIAEHRNISEGFKESINFWKIHGVPYSVWEKGEKEYQYDIGFSTEEQDKRNWSIAIMGYTKEGSYIYSSSNLPYVKWSENVNLNVTQNKKLPVQFSIRWHSQNGKQWYEAEVVLPKQMDKQVIEFQKKYGKDVFIIVGMDKILENEGYSYGKIWLENSKGKEEIMKFRTSKFSDKKNDFEVSKYSLPKGYVFPKWEGREPFQFPELDYWQEK